MASQACLTCFSKNYFICKGFHLAQGENNGGMVHEPDVIVRHIESVLAFHRPWGGGVSIEVTGAGSLCKDWKCPETTFLDKKQT